MKKEILKIAGVKSEKEFYKKFPDEASFMKAHGKEFKKAMRASKITKDVPKAQNALTIGGGGPAFGAGATNVGPGGNYTWSTGPLPNIDQSWTGQQPSWVTKYKMTNYPQSQSGATGKEKTTTTTTTTKNPNTGQYIEGATDLTTGVASVGQQKQDVAGSRQQMRLSGVQAQAADSRPLQPIKRQYVTPWDTVIQPEQMFPSYGVGTNVLAEDGAVINQIGGNPTEIMNTFAPNVIYTDLGYEPLNDSSRVKQYYNGGIRKAADGVNFDFEDFIQGGGGDALGTGFDMLTSKGGYQEAGSKIGGGAGRIIGTAIGGPFGGMLGNLAGRFIGGAIDQSSEKIAQYNKQSQANIGRIMGGQAGMQFQNQFRANVRDGGDIPKAQPGAGVSTERGNCAANPYQDVKEGVGAYAAPATKAELYPTRYKSLYSVMPSDRKERKAVIDAFDQLRATGTSPYLKDYSPEDYQAALYEANMYNRYFGQTGSEKMFDPSTGAVLPDYMSQVNNPAVSFYRSKFPQAKSITPEQIINLMPLSERRSLIGRGYKQENGGQTSEYEWISHTWQPQVITHFGEHKVSDLLRPPADADMLRAGGEVRSLRKNYMSPDEEMLTNMAFGGQIETTWGGHAEPISQNPYMPATGQTIMFRGQSHDESDGKGRTGIGVKYGKPDSYTEYAEYGTTSDADVEVERNEPAVEMPNGDGENSMVVFGNLKVPNQFLDEIGDPKAKSKKFKSYVKDLAKKENRQNKIIEKASEKLVDLDPATPFDKLKLNSLIASIEGANMKLKQFAEFKQNAAAVQNAINDTAEEMGLDADSLAKGRVKIDKKAFEGEAKYGKNIKKAQTGDVITDDELKSQGYTDNFIINARSSGMIPIRQGDKIVWKVSSSTTPTSSVSPVLPVITGQPAATQQPASDNDNDLTTELGETVTEDDLKRLRAMYEKAKSQKKGQAVVEFQREFHKLFPKSALKYNKETKFLTAKAKSLGVKKEDLDKIDINNLSGDLEKRVLQGNEDEFFGPITTKYMALAEGAKKRKTPKQNLVELEKLDEKDKEKTTGDETTRYPVTASKKKPFVGLASQLLDYIRPSDVEPLDPMQLSGELFALSQNQLEPVWAQKLQPRLSVPMDISLQDILNENEASFRAQQRMFGYSPAAQAELAANKYAANQKVLGEQFRMNQAEKQRVYEGNRNLLNQFDLLNMQTLDNQYVRQNEALSRTKATTQEALNSIASKIGQNKLENRMLATFENLYNYRFDPRFRARSFQIADFAEPTVYNASAQKGEVPVYDKEGNLLYYKIPSDKTTSATATAEKGKKVGNKEQRNSSIVKALKNL